MPEEAPACLAAAPGACSYCAPLDQHPKLSQDWSFWTAWGWFLDPVPMANLLFSFPSPWKGSAGWSAPNAPFYPLPVLQVEDGCSATLPWHSQGNQGCSLGSVWLQGQGWDAGLGTARVTGHNGGHVQVLLSRVCSSSSPSVWFKGLPLHLPQLRLLPGSQSPACSALLTSLPRRPAQQKFILP